MYEYIHIYIYTYIYIYKYKTKYVIFALDHILNRFLIFKEFNTEAIQNVESIYTTYGGFQHNFRK